MTNPQYLIHKIKTRPSSETGKLFETLVLSYGHPGASPETWQKFKADGIVQLTLDLLDPPEPRAFDVSGDESV